MKKIQAVLLILLCQCCFAQHWQPLGTGLNRYPTKLYVDSVANKLYVAGPFTTVNNQSIWGIASWNGVQWDSLGHGIDRDGYSAFSANTWGMLRYNGLLYIGGNCRYVGNDSIQALATWNGLGWDSVSGGRIKYPNALEDVIANGNNFYICGTFDSVGNISANSIARWDGISWNSLGNNYNFLPYGFITQMIFYHGTLYVAGSFSDTSSHTCRLAKLVGNSWQFLTNDIAGGFASIWDMKIFDDRLYVSGLFYEADGNAGNSIMRWNDTTWQDVGGGVQVVNNSYPTVKEMCVYNGKLYCVGNFEKIGGIPAMGLASWDENEWCGYNTDFEFSGQYSGAEHITFFHDTMYVGGDFDMVDNISNTKFIAKWIGGNYVDTCGVITTGIHEQIGQTNAVSLFPNPSSNKITFDLTKNNFSGQLLITDQLGREVKKEVLNGEKQIEISIADLPEGMYFYSLIENGERISSGKFVVQH